MKFFGKRGGLLLEASFVYPLVFLCMIGVICMIISMYIAAVSKAGLNIRLMEESMKQNDIGSMNLEHTNKFSQDKYSAPVFLKGSGIVKRNVDGKSVFQAIRENEYNMYGVSIRKITETQTSKIYDINEKEYIRKCDMVL